MNNYMVIYTPQAKTHAKKIIAYIKDILLSQQAAENFITKLKLKEAAISKDPHAFAKDYFGNRIYHKAMVGQYIIAFRIDEQTHTVHVIAIGHSRQKRKNIIKH